MDIESEPRKKQTNIQTHTPKQNNEKATTTKMTRGEKQPKIRCRLQYRCVKMHKDPYTHKHREKERVAQEN